MVTPHSIATHLEAVGKPSASAAFGAWRAFAIIAFVVTLTLAAQARAETVVIEDIMGRQVELETPVSRIVLGAGRQLPILGLIHKDPASLLVGWRDDFRRDETSFAAWAGAFPRLNDIPILGGVGGSGLDVETIVGLSPDLIILSLYDAEAPATQRSMEVLDALDIPVMVVDFFAHPLENSLPSLRMIANAVGAEERAEAFIAFYEERLEAVTSRLPDTIDRPDVFMHVHAGGMPCCATPGTGVFNEMIAIAGGRNIALDHVPGPYGDVSLEQLIVDDPDVYIAMGGGHLAARGGLVLGPGVDEDRARASFQKLLDNPGLAELTAVRDHRAQAIWHMFNDTPMHIAMIERLAKIFHPDLFADLDPDQTMTLMERDFLATPMPGTYWLAQ